MVLSLPWVWLLFLQVEYGNAGGAPGGHVFLLGFGGFNGGSRVFEFFLSCLEGGLLFYAQGRVEE